MPHDKHGNELKVGDKVLVPCLVESVSAGEEDCNATVRVALPPRSGDYRPLVALNTLQVVLADFPAASPPVFEIPFRLNAREVTP